MRKIEKEMCQALRGSKNWRKGNTSVVQTEEGCIIYLHGHRIAWVEDGIVNVDEKTLAKWPSPTTKSRLRALGVDVCTKNWVTYLNGKVV